LRFFYNSIQQKRQKTSFLKKFFEIIFDFPPVRRDSRPAPGIKGTANPKEYGIPAGLRPFCFKAAEAPMPSAPQLGGIRCRAGSIIALDIFKNVPGLTVQHLADGVQGAEADGPDFSCFQAGEVDVGYADLGGQIIEPHLSIRQHPIKPNNNHNV
jgi:hypothetical protein